MPKGKIANPGYIKVICQFCGKESDYCRTSSSIRKSCYNCLPEGQEANASLIGRLVKDKAVREKGNKCAICGKQYPNYVYDFHHLDPSKKDFNLGNKTSTVKWETVKKEIDKCILVCANCHRILHNEENVQINVGNDIE